MLSSCHVESVHFNPTQAVRRSRQPSSSLRRCVVEGEAASLKRTRFLEPVEQAVPVEDPSPQDEEPPGRQSSAACASLDPQPFSPVSLPSISTEVGKRLVQGGDPAGGASSPFASQQAQQVHLEEKEAAPMAGELPSPLYSL